MAAIARALQGDGKKAILLGGRSLRAPALMVVARIAARTGAKLFAEVFPTRIERGAGLPSVERITYLAELASVQLTGLDQLILVDVKAPVSFFAYPGKKSYLVPDGWRSLILDSAVVCHCMLVVASVPPLSRRHRPNITP